MNSRHPKLRATGASLFCIFTAAAILVGCDSGSSSPGANAESNPGAAGTAPTVTLSPAPPTSPPSLPAPRNYSTDAMLFVGDGTWSTEISSIENIFSAHNVTYQEVTSAQLDAMAVTDLAKFGMLVFPGGEGGTEAGSVSAQTHANLRAAVQQYGVSYIGFCAGSFIAVAPAPAAGQDVSYGFGVVNGPLLITTNSKIRGSIIKARSNHSRAARQTARRCPFFGTAAR